MIKSRNSNFKEGKNTALLCVHLLMHVLEKTRTVLYIRKEEDSMYSVHLIKEPI
jgi:hypothetical protein